MMFNYLMNRRFIWLGAAVVLAYLGGCGIYSFSPGGKSSIKTLAIPPIENRTIESGLTTRLTDIVIDAFIANGSMKIVSSDAADAVLIGALTKYERKAKTYDESDNVTQYAVYLSFDLALKDGAGEKEIWKDSFYSEGIYDAFTETEEDGQSRAAEKLVTDIINRTTRNW
jgi:hypothetical protein